MNNLQKIIEKHSSAILTGISIIGLGVTTGLTIKSTIKAVKIVEEEKQRQITYEKIYPDNHGYKYPVVPNFDKKDIIKMTWKSYIPVIVSGLSTSICILGIHCLNRRMQASLISAYALLDNTYKEYKQKMHELYPDDPKVINFEHEVIKSKFKKDMILDEDKQLFFDYQTMQYFESTMEDVMDAERHMNECLAEDGYVCINELYEYLDLPTTLYGWQMGWSYSTSDKLYSEDDIKLTFSYEKVVMDDGLECIIIVINYPKSLEYIY